VNIVKLQQDHTLIPFNLLHLLLIPFVTHSSWIAYFCGTPYLMPSCRFKSQFYSVQPTYVIFFFDIAIFCCVSWGFYCFCTVLFCPCSLCECVLYVSVCGEHVCRLYLLYNPVFFDKIDNKNIKRCLLCIRCRTTYFPMILQWVFVIKSWSDCVTDTL